MPCQKLQQSITDSFSLGCLCTRSAQFSRNSFVTHLTIIPTEIVFARYTLLFLRLYLLDYCFSVLLLCFLVDDVLFFYCVLILQVVCLAYWISLRIWYTRSFSHTPAHEQSTYIARLSAQSVRFGNMLNDRVSLND